MQSQEGHNEESEHEDWLEDETQYTEHSMLSGDSEWYEEEYYEEENYAEAVTDGSSCSSGSSSGSSMTPPRSRVNKPQRTSNGSIQINIPSNRPNEPEINLNDLLKKLADEDMAALFDNQNSFVDEFNDDEEEEEDSYY